MGDENGRIFERNFDKAGVNRGFKLFENYGERNKEWLKS